MNRVKYTTTTTGTGNCSLSAVQGFVNATDFQMTAGRRSAYFYTPYFLIDANGIDWEYGFADVTFNANPTLSRADSRVLESTNSRNRINLSAGTHTVVFHDGDLQGRLASFGLLHNGNTMVIAGPGGVDYFDAGSLINLNGANSDLAGLWTYFGVSAPSFPQISPINLQDVCSGLYQAYRVTALAKWGHGSGSTDGFLGVNIEIIDTFSGSMSFSNTIPFVSETLTASPTLTCSTPWIAPQGLNLDGGVSQYFGSPANIQIQFWHNSSGTKTLYPRLIVELMF